MSDLVSGSSERPDEEEEMTLSKLPREAVIVAEALPWH